MSQQGEESSAALKVQDTEVQNRFADERMQDAKKNILSRLPVMDIIKCRLVCRDWRGILSSRVSESSSSSLSSESCADFLKNFWLEKRPMERWLFLYTEQTLGHNVLYDIKRNVCYSWCPTPDHELTHLLQITGADQLHFNCNTTANGLVFLMQLQRPDSAVISKPVRVKIWTYNPLTRCQNSLPDVYVYYSGYLIVAKEDTATANNSEPHYKVLLLGNKPAYHDKIWLFLYSSRERRWQKQKSLDISYRNFIEVNRFYEHDSICFLESSVLYTGLGEEDYCMLRWFNVEDQTWNSCAVSPPGDIDSDYITRHFYLFDRNKELILLAPVVNAVTRRVGFRVYKSSLSIKAGMDTISSWILLSSMPENETDDYQGSIPVAKSSESQPRFQYLSFPKCQVYPLPDKVDGDKLVIIVMNFESYQVLSFDFKCSPLGAWKTLISSPDLQIHATPRETTLEEKIGQWTQSTLRSYMYQRFGQLRFQSGSLQGFTFEPRLDDL